MFYKLRGVYPLDFKYSSRIGVVREFERSGRALCPILNEFKKRYKYSHLLRVEATSFILCVSGSFLCASMYSQVTLYSYKQTDRNLSKTGIREQQ